MCRYIEVERDNLHGGLIEKYIAGETRHCVEKLEHLNTKKTPFFPTANILRIIIN